MNKSSPEAKFKLTLLKVAHRYGLFSIACITSLAFLLFDLFLPLGVAAGVSYIAIVLLSLWFPSRHQIITITLLSVLLIIIGYLLLPEGGIKSIVLFNRVLSLFAVVSTGSLIYLSKATADNSASSIQQPYNGDAQAGNILTVETVEKNTEPYDSISSTGFRGLLAGFPILLLIIGISFFANKKQDESFIWVSHTHEVRGVLSSVLSILIDAETGQRGYLLTGEETYLEPYSSAVKQLEADFKKLRELTLDNSYQQDRLDKIEPLIKLKLTALSETIFIRKSEGLNAAKRIVATDKGKIIMDQLRVIIDEMKAEEISLLAEREEVTYHNKLFSQLISILGFILLITIGIIVAVKVRSLLTTIYANNKLLVIAKKEEEQSNKNLQILTEKIKAQARRLSAVIDNVVDGIITIDKVGNIESFNPAATEIFGYKDVEVIGKNVKILMPEPYHSEHDGYLDNYLTTGENKIIGIGREVIGRRNNGSTFPMELAVSEVAIDNTQHFVGITRDITERKRIEQMQKEFISTVSHELRTPLTSISGSLGLILGGVTGEIPEKAQAMLTIANNNSERLIHLINDILDIEKISSGKMLFDFHVTNLITVIQKAIEANRGYGEKLNVAFTFKRFPEQEVMVRIDETRIEQVMANLLSNAAKYSLINSQVEVSVEAFDNHVRVSVHNNGEGIPEAFKSKVFTKFSQADSSDTRQKGGTGLGLNISQAIINQHKGTIGFESVAGSSTTFYFDLPLWIEQPQVKKTVNEAHLEKPRVLIVEDDEDVSKMLSTMLENEGFHVHQAYHYQQALQQIALHHYDAITLDLIIPGGSGISILRELRSNEATSQIPVIVVSVKANEGRRVVESESMEMVDWMEKPINVEQLMVAIRSGISHGQDSIARVLHVEDDSDIAVIVESLLGDAYQVKHAKTLAQARTLVSNEAFDLVLLDVGLPDGSGLDLLPILQESDHPAPVIIFSAKNIPGNIASQVMSTLLKSKTDNEKLVQQINLAISRKT